MLRRTVVVDLDGTLTVNVKSLPYPDKPLQAPVARAAEAAREQGLGVMVLTARGMRTYKNDRSLVEQHVKPQVETWIAKHGLPVDSVVVAKPWCGPRGFYVDDRALHPEEFVFRFTGPWAGQTFAAIVQGPVDDIHTTHMRMTRVERWLEVTSWRYPDAEQSFDDTGDKLIGAEVAAPWTLVMRTTGPNLAGWLAMQHEQLDDSPVVFRFGDAGFAIVPTTLVEAHGTDLAALETAVGDLE